MLHSCSAPYTAVLSINFGFENTPSYHARIKHQGPMQNHTLVPPPRCSVRLFHHHDSTRRVRFQTHAHRGDTSARRTHSQSRQCTGRAVPPPSLKSIQLTPSKRPVLRLSSRCCLALFTLPLHAALPNQSPQSTRRRLPSSLLSAGSLLSCSAMGPCGKSSPLSIRFATS